MRKELTIGKLHEIYQKYGDLGFKVRELINNFNG